MDRSGSVRQAPFPSTSWSMIRGATDRLAPDWRDRLGHLLSLYWKPIYLWIRWHWPSCREEAEDLTQGFFALLLEGEYLEQVRREQGSFRSYLKTALNHFLVDQKRHRSAAKRGGALERIPMDTASLGGLLLDSQAASPDELFEQSWIATCLDEAVRGLKEILEAEGRGKYFAVFQACYVDTEPSSSSTHAGIAAKLGLQPHDVGNYLVYARRRFRDILMDEVGDTTATDADAAQELLFVLGES